ncbi:hypothetical protein SYNPS1DRAFT_30464 [Syncephalis pseudoplumigaleata]|uniref:Acyl-CoA dehydrogenase/oxidase n=1 Tax=Syncephalis pseudoplumigaleata TaxID=1712513 RepID=A0A4P9YXT6_9FUNG|nr:hypothetical protein SYNPS1DRAFT_30464 [Syncephalis pseudoplumigaleata]|eukprot:RKP23780.1 hypothetical protein SYNPS1DRAFT_30464 [Syncephalis pseudoplumigaleata]
MLPDAPVLGNQFTENRVLRGILQRYVPIDVYASFLPDLERFGGRVVDGGDALLLAWTARLLLALTRPVDIARMGDDAENHPPVLRQFDPWCRRVDELSTSEGWRQLKSVAAEEGLVAIAYERVQNEHSRLYQFAKLLLFAPMSAMFSCPLAMTDGAARVLELSSDDELKRRVLPRLTTRDPSRFWTSGQWMTERPGGSDVSRTETKAEPVDHARNEWHVSGFKWFSSATDADMTLLLARARDPRTHTFREGSRGLSVFFAEMRLPDGKLNGVRIHRLKHKFGTKAVPTAELELERMHARLVGSLHHGVPTIASILNITRMYCAIGVCSQLGIALAMAKEYARIRTAQNKRLADLPLHTRTLADIELTYRAAMQLTFYGVAMLGRVECPGRDTAAARDHQTLFRILAPVIKLWTAKRCVAAISEAMEALGGQGYMEDVLVARCYRDAQVNTIWEGTTNILSLDLLRVIVPNHGDAFLVLSKAIRSMVVSFPQSLAEAAGNVLGALHAIEAYIRANIHERERLEYGARSLAFAVAQTVVGGLLIEHAQHTGAPDDLDAAHRWCLSVPALVGDLALVRPETAEQGEPPSYTWTLIHAG